MNLPVPGLDLPGVINSSGALSLKELPEDIIIIGGGVIGIEFATVFGSVGSKVTVVEMLPEILPPMDSEAAKLLHKKLERRGIRIMTKTALKSVTRKGDQLQALVQNDAGQETLSTNCVLVATGRKPNVTGLGLDKVGVKMAGKGIAVDEHFRTNKSSIYAIGDCNGLHMLAHAASAQGAYAAEHIMGETGYYNKNAIPNCIYCVPQIASVGLTEEQAKAEKIPYHVGRFPLVGNGKSMIEQETDGFIKILFDDKWGKILGAHAIGANVSEQISEMTLAINLEATEDEIIATIHPHPTVNEAFGEVALAAQKRAIHFKQ